MFTFFTMALTLETESLIPLATSAYHSCSISTRWAMSSYSVSVSFLCFIVLFLLASSTVSWNAAASMGHDALWILLSHLWIFEATFDVAIILCYTSSPTMVSNYCARILNCLRRSLMMTPYYSIVVASCAYSSKVISGFYCTNSCGMNSGRH